MAEQWGFDTLKVRAGYNPAKHNQSVAGANDPQAFENAIQQCRN
jgi:hypothetical protein